MSNDRIMTSYAYPRAIGVVVGLCVAGLGFLAAQAVCLGTGGVDSGGAVVVAALAGLCAFAVRSRRAAREGLELIGDELVLDLWTLGGRRHTRVERIRAVVLVRETAGPLRWWNIHLQIKHDLAASMYLLDEGAIALVRELRSRGVADGTPLPVRDLRGRRYRGVALTLCGALAFAGSFVLHSLLDQPRSISLSTIALMIGGVAVSVAGTALIALPGDRWR